VLVSFVDVDVVTIIIIIIIIIITNSTQLITDDVIVCNIESVAVQAKPRSGE